MIYTDIIILHKTTYRVTLYIYAWVVEKCYYIDLFEKFCPELLFSPFKLRFWCWVGLGHLVFITITGKELLFNTICTNILSVGSRFVGLWWCC